MRNDKWHERAIFDSERINWRCTWMPPKIDFSMCREPMQPWLFCSCNVPEWLLRLRLHSNGLELLLILLRNNMYNKQLSLSIETTEPATAVVINRLAVVALPSCSARPKCNYGNKSRITSAGSTGKWVNFRLTLGKCPISSAWRMAVIRRFDGDADAAFNCIFTHSSIRSNDSQCKEQNECSQPATDHWSHGVYRR